MLEIDFFNLNTVEHPRTILESDFPRLGSLPIAGGWGYDQSTACIIDKADPSVSPDIPFDGIGLEYLFVRYRLYEELIVFRSKDEKYANISWKLLSQQTKRSDEGLYDILKFQVLAFRRHDFERLKSIYEGPDGFINPNFDEASHEKMHNSLLCVGEREYWFEISSFFGT